MLEQSNFTTPTNSAAILNPEALINRMLGELLGRRNGASGARAREARRIARGARSASTTLYDLSLARIDRELDSLRQSFRSGYWIRPREIYTDGAHQRRGTRRGGGRTIKTYDIVSIHDGRIVGERRTRGAAERLIERMGKAVAACNTESHGTA